MRETISKIVGVGMNIAWIFICIIAVLVIPENIEKSYRRIKEIIEL